MRISLKTTTIMFLAMACPFSALGNLSGSATLSINTALSLDTGTTSSSGGDVLWTTSMAPQGKATAVNFGGGGAAAFNILTQSILSIFPGYSATPISGSLMTVGDIFFVKTNGGNYAAVLVSIVSGATLTVSYTTFGVTVGPNVTGVLNNYSYTPAGFPNGGIAQGTLFIVTGTGLADPTKSAILQDSTMGLPSSLNGATVSVTSGGTTVTPVFYYAISTQLALVLPSNTPVGTAQLTVSYNNQTSAPFSFQVVTSAPGFATYYGSGSGLGAALNPTNFVPYSYANSIPPGSTVVLYGSGLGADAATDNKYVGAIFNINNLAHIYVGGVDAPIQYQGSFYYPGLNQINVTIPASAPTGCNVPLVGVTTAGLPTNFITVPIGTGPCSDAAFGITGNQLLTLSSQTNVKTGLVAVYHSTSPASSGSGTTVNDFALASFQSYTGTAYGTASGIVSVGGCIVNQALSASAATGKTTGLNAGSITVTSPMGMQSLLTAIPSVTGIYESQLISGFIPSTGGTFSFSGTQGSDVGSFSTTVSLSSPLLTWTNQGAAATVTRSSGLPVGWTGGASNTIVSISGSSIATSGLYGSFTCLVPTSAGSFTVPSYVLAALPAGTGSVTVSNQNNYTPFAAQGISLGFATGFVSYSANSTFN